jgi:hypothetical protein
MRIIKTQTQDSQTTADSRRSGTLPSVPVRAASSRQYGADAKLPPDPIPDNFVASVAQGC